MRRAACRRAVAAAIAATGIALMVSAAESDAVTLAARERDLLDRYRELEGSFLRLADLLAPTDPRRADALRAAFARAREEQVGDRLAAIVAMLEQGQLLKAGTSQEAAVEEFRTLLALLEEGAAERRAADAARQIRAFLGRVSKLITMQREVEGATEAGGDPRDAARRQRDLAAETDGLGGDVQRCADRLADEGRRPAAAGAAPDAAGEQPAAQPSDGAGDPASDQAGDPAGDPGGDQASEKPSDAEGDDDISRSRRTAARLRAAEARMRRAVERLGDAGPRAARDEQQRAVEELETARAELEEILRQMREEEVTRLLVQLEARLRGMLKAERTVAEDAARLAASGGQAARERQLEAARLSREQAAVTAEAARALTLLRDDGTAAALPQALGQVHDDSVEAAARLGRGDATAETLGLLGEIVAGIEEMLAAVEKARQDPPEDAAGGGRAAPAGAQPLVDTLAELKMLRTLQLRVNGRTRRLARLLDEADTPATDAEVRAVLARLAERQRAIGRAARDIVEGRTE
ncbi:MAG: hypothetical protein ACKO4T_13975 [Planctomycetaceae bacterium]